MGFQLSAPRFEFDAMVKVLDIWTVRADAAMITTEVPWDSLYSGISPEDFVKRNYVGLVNYYRSRGFALWIYIDPQNGLDRTSEANALASRGLSIADTEVQQKYQRFVVVMDSMLRPDHLGLALETNLIRDAAGAYMYKGVKTAVNETAAKLRSANTKAKLGISVQAEHAWGRFTGEPFKGIEADYRDFPFMEELGISSYPYLGYDSPASMPADFFQRIVAGKKLPVFITEGGYTSATINSYNGTVIISNPDLQAAYYRRQAQFLNSVNGIGWFQLSFTDIDMSALPAGVSPNIQYFAFLGLLDKDLKSKPSLAVWDSLYRLPWK
jgi:hypothetical protein